MQTQVRVCETVGGKQNHKQNCQKETKRERIRELMSRLTEFGIHFEEVISRYAEIDAYSQGKIRKQSVNFSSRNMGKNDIGIAATASVFDLKLVTTDQDFDHLQDDYIELLYISLDEMKNS